MFEEWMNEKKAFVRNKEEGKMMKQRRMKRKRPLITTIKPMFVPLL
jgi:hypothetical protein